MLRFYVSTPEEYAIGVLNQCHDRQDMGWEVDSNNDDDGQPATLVFVVKDEEKRVDVN